MTDRHQTIATAQMLDWEMYGVGTTIDVKALEPNKRIGERQVPHRCHASIVARSFTLAKQAPEHPEIVQNDQACQQVLPQLTQFAVDEQQRLDSPLAADRPLRCFSIVLIRRIRFIERLSQ